MGYDVDGVVLDWVRFDDWPMDLSDTSRALYQEAAGVDPIKLDFSVDDAQRQAWGGFRAAAIADHIAEVRRLVDCYRPGRPLGVFILPPEFEEVSQHADLFAADVDYVAPMAYFDDWGFNERWVWKKLLPDTVARVGDLPIVPTLDHDWGDATSNRVLDAVAEAGGAGVSWFKYWAWDSSEIERLMAYDYCGRRDDDGE